MAAYASHQHPSFADGYPSSAGRPRLAAITNGLTAIPGSIDSPAISELIDLFARRVAAAIADQLGAQRATEDEWFDCRHAADYLGVHRDSLRKLAAARAIPSEQDGPGCKLYFRRSDLDAWRRSGGRPRQLQATLANVA